MKDTLDTTSYWHKTASIPHYPTPEGNFETEVLIIGGGITGLTCAYTLAKKGVQTALIEADRLCGGTTGNTTGKATIQHGIIYSRLIKALGNDAAALYARSQSEALQFIRTFAQGAGEEVFRDNEAFLFGIADDELDLIGDEYDAARRLHIDVEYVESPEFPPRSRHLLGFRNQGVIHAVRYADRLAGEAAKAGAHLFEHTKAVHMDGGDINLITCENGLEIRAKHVILATQYPFYEGLALNFTKLYPRRTYGIAVRPAASFPDGCYINPGSPSRSIRTHYENGEQILIVVGEGHTTARSGDMEHHFDELMQYATMLAGFDDLLAKWSAQDYKTPDDMPYIGRTSKGSHIYVATGYGKWGITSGTLAGLMLPEIITAGKSDYEELYKPYRMNLRAGAGTYLSEVSQQVRELIKSKLDPTDSLTDLKPGEGRIIRYEGKRAGAYLSDEGRLTIVDTTCTHIGCEVHWNSAERSWDCACHGGRYAADGTLLEGPPPDPLKILYQDRD